MHASCCRRANRKDQFSACTESRCGNSFTAESQGSRRKTRSGQCSGTAPGISKPRGGVSFDAAVGVERRDGVAAAERATRQFKRQGMGGVFIHPRPGLMTEYLGADWFRLWKLSLEEGKRLGLLVNIYDENSYPSGFAGGHVPSRAPDTASQFVQVDVDHAASLAACAEVGLSRSSQWKSGGRAVVSAKRVRSVDEVPNGASLISYQLRRASGNPWTGEFPYVDLTNPQTTRRFSSPLTSSTSARRRGVRQDRPLGLHRRAACSPPAALTTAKWRCR